MIFIFMMVVTLTLIACNNNDSNGNAEDETGRAHLAFKKVVDETDLGISISNVRWICFENQWNDGEKVEGCKYFFTYRLPNDNTDNYGEAWSRNLSWLANSDERFFTYETLDKLNEWYDKELLSAQNEANEPHIESVVVTTGVMSSAQIREALNKAKALD